ncbi:hypothetical protein I79_016310 [Cricetulus griseus]|uniref:Uncharacterized protein n=1 Tax=Cricetulus griseus TaxID=10029 RepID=G3HZ15_CRIGR|nr:hypothetical protein I79_016310 [Cricetulus griseus]
MWILEFEAWACQCWEEELLPGGSLQALVQVFKHRVTTSLSSESMNRGSAFGKGSPDQGLNYVSCVSVPQAVLMVNPKFLK